MSKKALTNSEITNLKEEKRELENTIKELDSGAGAGTRGAALDRAALQRQATALGKVIHEGTPVEATGVEAQRFDDRRKELAEQIKDGMPTLDQMHNPGKHPGMIRKNYEWQKRNAGKIQEYKEIMRRLDPSDPTAASVENLRRR